MNNAGVLAGTASGGTLGTTGGLIVSDGTTVLDTILNSPGAFDTFGNVSINDSNNIAFDAMTTAGIYGIFTGSTRSIKSNRSRGRARRLDRSPRWLGERGP